MKVRFNRQEMAEALAAVTSVAAARTPKEILKCVSIDAHSDFLLLSATDLELGIRRSISQVEVGTQGRAVANADMFARIVRESSDDLLSLEIQDSTLHIRGVDSHFQVVTRDPADFPLVPSIDGEPDFTVNSLLINRLIEWTVFAAARESTRYAINGVLWKLEGDKLTLAATDGRRLSVAHGGVTTGTATKDLHVILPVKALSLLSRVVGEVEGTVGVKLVGNHLLLHAGPTTISTSLVEGRFPNYTEVIPTDCNKEIELNTVTFQSALKRAALLTNEESKGVRLAFRDGTLTLSGRAPEQGEATVSVEVPYSGPPLDIGFNPVFLLDVLRVAHSETITLALKESTRPGVVSMGHDLVYVIMPVNLS